MKINKVLSQAVNINLPTQFHHNNNKCKQWVGNLLLILDISGNGIIHILKQMKQKNC